MIAVETTTPNGRHQADGHGPAAQSDHIDMQRARKQEKCEHAIKNGFLEIDLAQQCGQTFIVEQPRHRGLGPDDHERGAKPHDEQADGVRQKRQPEIDPTERGRQDQQDCGKLELRHRVYRCRLLGLKPESLNAILQHLL